MRHLSYLVLLCLGVAGCPDHPVGDDDVSSNSGPGSAIVQIQPHDPGEGEALEAVLLSESVDPDGDEVLYTWAWYRNNHLQTQTSPVIEAGLTVEGEIWRVQVQPSDGEVAGPATTYQVFIGPPPPPDADSDGWDVTEDCDDHDATIHPGAEEGCNGVDDDCDGVIPQDEEDSDGDGYRVCDGDCDDDQPATWPGAPEQCDGEDNDCDGTVDEGVDEDVDGDGHSTCGGDCDDGDATVFPGADEACDGVDGDCDGVVPADELDADGDGLAPCEGDCDDTSAAIWPGAPEQCDGIDNDCDGDVDEGVGEDLDGDGLSACDGDCDDTDPGVHPGAVEVCNGRDDD